MDVQFLGRPENIYINQVCADTGCRLENLPGAVDDRDERHARTRERERESQRSLFSQRDLMMMKMMMMDNVCFYILSGSIFCIDFWCGLLFYVRFRKVIFF